MKNFSFYLLIITALFAISCSQQPKEKSVPIKPQCQQFLEEYETWMDNYVEVIRKHKSNPQDGQTRQMYMKLTKEAPKWDENHECDDNESFMEKYREISLREKAVLAE